MRFSSRAPEQYPISSRIDSRAVASNPDLARLVDSRSPDAAFTTAAHNHPPVRPVRSASWPRSIAARPGLTMLVRPLPVQSIADQGDPFLHRLAPRRSSAPPVLGGTTPTDTNTTTTLTREHDEDTINSWIDLPPPPPALVRTPFECFGTFIRNNNHPPAPGHYSSDLSSDESELVHHNHTHTSSSSQSFFFWPISESDQSLPLLNLDDGDEKEEEDGGAAPVENPNGGELPPPRIPKLHMRVSSSSSNPFRLCR